MADDITEILQLLHRYCHALDRGSVDEILDVFHPDAVLLPRYQGDESHRGREAIRGWYVDYENTVKAAVRELRHKITCPWIQVQGKEATSVAYLDADYVARESGEMGLAAGRYEDKLVKEKGRWWLRERAILLHGVLPLGRPSPH
jgi:ketosteroid isomerase-like protein